MFLTSRFLWLNLLLKNIVMTKRTSWFLSVAATVIVLMGGGYVALRHSRTQVHALINQSLQEAERLHYNDRLNAFSKNPHIYVDPAIKAYLFAPVSSRKIKSYTLQTTEEKTTYLFKDSIPEEKARKLLNEYLLADIQPVKVEEVNRLFQEQLEKKHVSGTAGVFYSDKSARTRTRAGILPTSSAYKTPVYSLDLTHSLQLQGWADYDLLTLLRYIHAGFYGLLCLLLAATGIQVCLYLKKRRNKPEKGLYIDLKQQILLIDGIQCAISSLDLQLLYLLWEKKGECVNREDLKTTCWPHDPQADEKLDTHIQTIRKVLQDFPDYRISTVKGRGYYLTAASTKDSAPN